MNRTIFAIGCAVVLCLQGCGKGLVAPGAAAKSSAAAADVNARDKDGKTPLILAIEKGEKAAVADLVSRGANLNEGFNGEQPIHAASRAGQKEVVELLISKGVSPLVKTQGDLTCLHLASTRDVAELLVSKGIDVNVQSNYRERPLHLAAQRGNAEVVRYLLENGADPLARAKDMDVMTLNYASTQAVAELLVAKGALINGASSENERNTPPIFSAAWNGYADVVLWLAEQGADVNAKNYSRLTAIQAGVERGHVDVVTALLAKGAQTATPQGMGRGLLSTAVEKANVKMVQVLLDAGLSPNESHPLPLHIAAGEGNKEILELLLARGADPALQESRSTALHAAADTRSRKPAYQQTQKVDRSREHLECVQILLKRGADVRAMNNSKLTPLHLAAACNFKAGAEALLSAGAEVDAKAQFDATPLHWAVINNADDVVALLLEKGANANAGLSPGAALITTRAGDMPNPFGGAAVDGKTPLSLATSAGMKDLLAKHGATLAPSATSPGAPQRKSVIEISVEEDSAAPAAPPQPAGGSTSQAKPSAAASSSEKVMNVAIPQALKLKAQADTQALQNAITQFKEIQGKSPRSLEELVQREILDQLPEPPPGTRYLYHPENGTVEFVADRSVSTATAPTPNTPIAGVSTTPSARPKLTTASVEDMMNAAGNTQAAADLKKITVAVNVFQMQEERFPASLDELVTKGLLEKLPALPKGKSFTYDPQTGKAGVVTK